MVLILVIGLAAGIWTWRTKDFDFMTPKGIVLGPDDQGADLVEGIFSGESPGTVSSEVIPPEVAVNDDEKVEVEKVDLGTLDVSPGLYEYLPAAENGPDYLFKLVDELKADGRFQRALLVLERVIDATDANSDQKMAAAKEVKALVPTLPAWNIDPASQSSLELHFGTARPSAEDFKVAALEVAQLVQKSSGEQLVITPTISTGSPENAVPNGPIALWVATGGEPSASTAVLSITPQEEAVLKEEFALALYKLVRGHLARSGYSTESPPTGVAGTDLLSFYVTRRMWYDFAQAMVNEQRALGGEIPGQMEEDVEAAAAEMVEESNAD